MSVNFMKGNSFKLFFLFTFLLIVTATRSQVLESLRNDSTYAIINKNIQETPLFTHRQWETNEADIIKYTDSQPAFGVYKDNLFLTGFPLNKSINKQTADVFLQISIRHRLTRSRLPFNSFLYLTYTQKSFWNIYAKSAPFKDNNYNPGIGIGRYIIYDNKLYGIMCLQLEHESNGKDGSDSRSWNMISMSAKYFINYRLSVSGKLWLPYVDGDENKDLLTYRGLGYFSIEYLSRNQRWWITAEVSPRKKVLNINTTLTAAYQISKNNNLYLYARFFEGTGENLLEFNKYTINTRFGICIKPDFSSIF